LKLNFVYGQDQSAHVTTFASAGGRRIMYPEAFARAYMLARANCRSVRYMCWFALGSIEI